MTDLGDPEQTLVSDASLALALPDEIRGDATHPAAAAQTQRFAVTRTAFRMWRTRIGALVTLAVVLIAVLGPLVAPHSPTQFVAAPFSAPSRALPLGSDYLGHDAFSRVLDGGVSILVLAAVATLIGVGAGA